MTIQEYFDSSEFELHNLTDVDPEGLYLLWFNFIERNLQLILKEENPTEFITNFPLTTVKDQSDYTLPSTCKNLANFDTGVYPADSNGKPSGPSLLVAQFGESNSVGIGVARGVRIRTEGDTLIFEPTPKATDKYIIRFNPIVIKKTSLAQETIIPDRFSEQALTALKMMYYGWDRKYGEKNIMAGDFNNVIEFLRMDANITSHAY